MSRSGISARKKEGEGTVVVARTRVTARGVRQNYLRNERSTQYSRGTVPAPHAVILLSLYMSAFLFARHTLAFTYLKFFLVCGFAIFLYT
jgi:hypothetical protein